MLMGIYDISLQLNNQFQILKNPLTEQLLLPQPTLVCLLANIFQISNQMCITCITFIELKQTSHFTGLPR